MLTNLVHVYGENARKLVLFPQFAGIYHLIAQSQPFSISKVNRQNVDFHYKSC